MQVYLDHASTTPMDPLVAETMEPILKEHFGNASSVHRLGRKARAFVEESREKVAAALGSRPQEIVFTSGGTEANNTVVRVVSSAVEGTLVVSSVEHDAMLRPAEELSRSGVPVRLVPPGPDGVVRKDELVEHLEGAALVSVLLVNNEIGSISPVRELAGGAHDRGALFHTDAVQAPGILDVNVERLDVDMMSISGHKVYGPKGAGVLFVREGVPYRPLLVGGTQEHGRRAGTENVAAIVGMARALELAEERREEYRRHLARLRSRLLKGIHATLENNVVINSPTIDKHCSPHILNLSLRPSDGRSVDGEMLLLALDMEGVAVSSGSACASGSLRPSHVLEAIGRDPLTVGATVRFSLGWGNTEPQIDYVVDRFQAVARRLRETA